MKYFVYTTILLGAVWYVSIINERDSQTLAMHECVYSMADTEGVVASPRELWDLFAPYCASIINNNK